MSNGFYTSRSGSDYHPFGSPDKTGSDLQTGTANLYNGNIGSMVTTIVPPTITSGGLTYAPAPQGTAYRYDRLNRLKHSNAWQDIDVVNNTWATGNGSTYAGMYENNFTYDANGNILKQGRKDATGTYIDTLTYQYAVDPLARTELGEHTVQGIDYAYTLQGWLKGVNSESLYADRDMGLDGSQALLPDGSENSNKNFARDAFGFSLDYHNSDYTPIDATATFLADKTGSNLLSLFVGVGGGFLYNGNISSMVTTIVPPTLNSGGTVTYAPAPQGTAYKYDRLNRLKSSNAWQDINAVGNVWATGNGSTYFGMYENTFSYDAAKSGEIDHYKPV